MNTIIRFTHFWFSDHYSAQASGKLFCCFLWNLRHENWEKSWNPGQNLPLTLSVSWIPGQCLYWIPRQYCCYNDAFAAALWLFRLFWVINFWKAEELKLIQFYNDGNCFDWHEKSQSTNRDTHDWYQNCSMSSNNGRLWWSAELVMYSEMITSIFSSSGSRLSRWYRAISDKKFFSQPQRATEVTSL